MSQQKEIILVGGPTASGKSAMALDLAQKRNGVVINSDALQIYSGLPILTGQPAAAERAKIPHELYGVIEPFESSSAGRWLGMVVPILEKTLGEGRTPILVGGTGLYFHALLGGLSDIPPVPETVRAEIQQMYEKCGEAGFRQALAALDPVSAERIARNDRQRLIRAYEVVVHTRKTLGEWQGVGDKGQGTRNEGQGNAKKLASLIHIPSPLALETHLLFPPRDELYATCDRRFLTMIEQGAIDEVKRFLERGLDPFLPAMKTIGVREIGAYLNGACTLDNAITKAQQMTRNYAKRQMTWFRNQGFGAD